MSPTPTPFTLKLGNSSIISPVSFLTIGEIISKLLPYIFVLTGLTLFFILTLNGFKFLTSAGDPKKAESAKQGVTSAIVGFLIVFVSYWIIQILEFTLHISILK